MGNWISNQYKIVSDQVTKTAKKESVTPIFGVDTIERIQSNPAIQQANAAAMAASTQPDTNSTTESIQRLFSSSPVTSKGSHDFRNKRHLEFLEQNPFAVRLRSYVATDTVVAFRASPDIIESRHIAYKAIDPLHMPGAIQIFQNSAPRAWNLTGIKLTSRNGVEAEENLAIINQLRAWQVPFFGESQTRGREDYQAEMFGAPPEVLEFTAYSKAAEEGLTNIRQIPVVITSLSIPYSSDVDYIRTATTDQPFPVVMQIDIALLETHSPREFNKFNLIDYKNGKLKGF